MNQIVNEEQTAYWNEEAGPKWVQFQEKLDHQMQWIADKLLEVAAVCPGERVLDIGCGCGATTLALAEGVGAEGRVTGADFSEPMLDHARGRAAKVGLSNVDFIRCDVQTHAFEGGVYDATVSKFGVMFFEDPVTAFTNMRAALKPKGRLSFLCWRPAMENEATRIIQAALAKHIELPKPEPDAPGQFSLADPHRVRRILGDAGYTNIRMDPYDNQSIFGGGGDIEETLEYLFTIGPVQSLTKDLDDEKCDHIRETLRDVLGEYMTPEGVKMNAAIWIVRADNG